LIGLSLCTDAEAYTLRPTHSSHRRRVMRVTLSMLLALLIMLGTLACDHADC